MKRTNPISNPQEKKKVQKQPNAFIQKKGCVYVFLNSRCFDFLISLLRSSSWTFCSPAALRTRSVWLRIVQEEKKTKTSMVWEVFGARIGGIMIESRSRAFGSK